MTHTKITIPKCFAENRFMCDLPMGEGRWTSRGYRTVLNPEDLADLKSDAEYHVEIGRLGGWTDPRGMVGVVASAKATLRAIARCN